MDDKPDDLEALAAAYRATKDAFRPIWSRGQEPATGSEGAEHYDAAMRLARAIQGRGPVVAAGWSYEGEVAADGKVTIHSKLIDQADQ
jgi:thioesterase domain-containing protein